jgi:streptomycin 6-kinase
MAYIHKVDSNQDNGSSRVLSMMDLSEDFTQRVLNIYGEDGHRWLQSLPTILDEISSIWDVRLKPPFQDLSMNYVAPAIRSDGSDAVLKVGVPNPELETEIAALKVFDGLGVVNIFQSNQELGALLLERLRPGEPLLQMGDDEFATAIAIKVIRQLHSCSAKYDSFPSVADWFQGFQRLRDMFGGDTGPFPNELIETAEVLSQDLITSMEASILLHADLHHWNILSAEREQWLAIDPKGVIGEPAYETGAWLRNPFPDILEMPNPERMISRRIDQFANDLGYDRERIFGWGFTQAVLASCWSFEDGEKEWEDWLAVAEVIASSK